MNLIEWTLEINSWMIMSVVNYSRITHEILQNKYCLMINQAWEFSDFERILRSFAWGKMHEIFNF